MHNFGPKASCEPSCRRQRSKRLARCVFNRGQATKPTDPPPYDVEHHRVVDPATLILQSSCSEDRRRRFLPPPRVATASERDCRYMAATGLPWLEVRRRTASTATAASMQATPADVKAGR